MLHRKDVPTIRKMARELGAAIFHDTHPGPYRYLRVKGYAPFCEQFYTVALAADPAARFYGPPDVASVIPGYHPLRQFGFGYTGVYPYVCAFTLTGY